jgi:hypothetical protein
MCTKLNTPSISATNELKSFGNSEILKAEIMNWVFRYNPLYNSFQTYPESNKDQLLFYNCYSNLYDLSKAIKMEAETVKALQEFKEVNIHDELQLLKWLVDYEYLKDNFITLSGNTITEESLANGRGQILKGLDVYFKTELIQNCIDFDITFNQYYIPIIRKYNTFSKEEEDGIMPFDDNYDEITSLKYHLEKRGILV